MKELQPKVVMLTRKGAESVLKDRLENEANKAKLSICEAQIFKSNETIIKQNIEAIRLNERVTILNENLRIARGWNVKIIIGVGLIFVARELTR